MKNWQNYIQICTFLYAGSSFFLKIFKKKNQEHEKNIYFSHNYPPFRMDN
jgi:hypothetical protein